MLRAVERSPEWEALERQASLSASMLENPSSFDVSAVDLHSAATQPKDRDIEQLVWPPPGKTKCRFVDFAIAPVQRVCRYPLLFEQIARSMRDQANVALQQTDEASKSFKNLAERVDAAKRERERALCASTISKRISPSDVCAFAPSWLD